MVGSFCIVKISGLLGEACFYCPHLSDGDANKKGSKLSAAVNIGSLLRLANYAYGSGMTSRELLELAIKYHQALSGRIRKYLNDRGIPDLQIDGHLLGWNGQRITIPVFDRSGELAFFKLARDPEDPFPGSKMITTPGAHAEIYGWDEVLREPAQIVICEGESDRLVLEANGFSGHVHWRRRIVPLRMGGGFRAHRGSVCLLWTMIPPGGAARPRSAG
jgi:hypothetical protein